MGGGLHFPLEMHSAICPLCMMSAAVGDNCLHLWLDREYEILVISFSHLLLGYFHKLFPPVTQKIKERNDEC
jgi:hypothetical protein